MTTLDQRIRQAEHRLFDELGLNVHERFLELPSTGLRLRVLAAGHGRPLPLLHGVTQTGAIWGTADAQTQRLRTTGDRPAGSWLV